MSDSMSNEFLSKITKKLYFVILMENFKSWTFENWIFSKSGYFEKCIISGNG